IAVNDVVQQPYMVRGRSSTEVADVANTNSHTVSVIAVSRQLEAVYDDKAGTDAIGPGNLESTPSEASGGDLATLQLRAALNHIAPRCRCLATARDIGTAWVRAGLNINAIAGLYRGVGPLDCHPRRVLSSRIRIVAVCGINIEIACAAIKRCREERGAGARRFHCPVLSICRS